MKKIDERGRFFLEKKGGLFVVFGWKSHEYKISLNKRDIEWSDISVFSVIRNKGDVGFL